MCFFFFIFHSKILFEFGSDVLLSPLDLIMLVLAQIKLNFVYIIWLNMFLIIQNYFKISFLILIKKLFNF